eukprot:Gregarina_sp_Poly_1__4964@NODE_262_length_10455_cov_153_948017_g229_i0_p9_GENE_NODE_262_length_10455_cov_153_948017_g229_i0NODE_262_length_10455_cov_153_948017_g229_i0_p9_ORF_typecomplete_len111_score8_64_NODE_262_length_10455_cov_153_948017_g229_i014161748
MRLTQPIADDSSTSSFLLYFFCHTSESQIFWVFFQHLVSFDRGHRCGAANPKIRVIFSCVARTSATKLLIRLASLRLPPSPRRHYQSRNIYFYFVDTEKSSELHVYVLNP